MKLLNWTARKNIKKKLSALLVAYKELKQDDPLASYKVKEISLELADEMVDHSLILREELVKMFGDTNYKPIYENIRRLAEDKFGSALVPPQLD